MRILACIYVILPHTCCTDASQSRLLHCPSPLIGGIKGASYAYRACFLVWRFTTTRIQETKKKQQQEQRAATTKNTIIRLSRPRPLLLDLPSAKSNEPEEKDEVFVSNDSEELVSMVNDGRRDATTTISGSKEGIIDNSRTTDGS